MKIGFAGDGWGEYLYWQQQDTLVYNRKVIYHLTG